MLTPERPVGCCRLTPRANYLESLRDDNVQTVFGEITEITPAGVVCDNSKGEYPVDVLICATGFNTTFKRLAYRSCAQEIYIGTHTHTHTNTHTLKDG